MFKTLLFYTYVFNKSSGYCKYKYKDVKNRQHSPQVMCYQIMDNSARKKHQQFNIHIVDTRKHGYRL